MPDKGNKPVHSAGDDELSRRVPPAIPEISKLPLEHQFIQSVESGLRKAVECAAASGAPQPSSLVTALSGGPDSSALLAALVVLAPSFGFKLSACHVNHALRAEESRRDEDFCRTLCSTWSVPLVVKNMAAGASAQAHSVPESTLRDARYELLLQCCEENDIDCIALGHTLDDQIETMLFRLFRGTARKGLLAMQPARRIDSKSLLRPLLQSTRQQCLEYLGAIGMTAIHDSSNDDIRYARNYIRHRIIPVIAEQFPGFQKRMDQFRTNLQEEEALLDAIAQQLIAKLDESKWPLDQLANQPDAILKRVIAHALEQRGIEVSYERVDMIRQIVKNGSGAMSLNARWDVKADAQRLSWVDGLSGGAGRMPVQQELRIPGMNIIPPWGLALRIEEWATGIQEPGVFPAAREWEALVDLHGISRPLVARLRAPGDVIQPFGMSEMVKVKRYLQTHKSQPAEIEFRRDAIVIADQNEVLWIPGVGISEKIRVKARPSHRLSWVKILQDDVNLC